MLIVIVIIGILAAALIPRLTWAQSKARNTARKADLNQIMIWLNAYQTDNSKFPTELGELAEIYLRNIPKDPSWVKWCDQASEWSYYYKAVEKDGVQDGWYILQAFMEKEWTNASANFFSDGCFTEGSQLEECKWWSCKGKENPKYVITQ